MTVENTKPDAPDDTIDRRDHLVTGPNPDPNVDYIVSLSEDTGSGGVNMRIDYIPDKWTVRTEAFANYLKVLHAEPFDTIEEFALAALTDFNNEVVPRWCQITASRAETGVMQHRVIVEDRQPNWNNDTILARLNRK